MVKLLSEHSRIDGEGRCAPSGQPAAIRVYGIGRPRLGQSGQKAVPEPLSIARAALHTEGGGDG